MEALTPIAYPEAPTSKRVLDFVQSLQALMLTPEFRQWAPILGAEAAMTLASVSVEQSLGYLLEEAEMTEVYNFIIQWMRYATETGCVCGKCQVGASAGTEAAVAN